MKLVLLCILLLLLLGCKGDHKTVETLELDRFMGDWYVISILPNPIEKNAVNSIESYALNEDGTISIRYTFFKGSVDGKKKVMKPKAKIYNHDSNAEWRVQMFKPFWSPYLVIDLAEDYRYTAIGVPNKKFLWIMSRTPVMSAEDYASVIDSVAKQGYNIDKIKKIPQIW